MTYTIGEMAKLLKIPASTLRYYDKKGLLPFVKRDKNGLRLFKDEDYEWLQIINCLKKTGMALDDIKNFVLMSMQGDSTIDCRLALIQKQRSLMLEKINNLKNMLEVLDYKVWYYETAKERGSTAALREISDGELPKRFVKISSRLKKLSSALSEK